MVCQDSLGGNYLPRFNRHPWQVSVSTRYTVLSRNRDQFLRIVAVHHSGRTPTAVDARHDYHVGLDAMQSWVPPRSLMVTPAGLEPATSPAPGEQGRSIPLELQRRHDLHDRLWRRRGGGIGALGGKQKHGTRVNGWS